MPDSERLNNNLQKYWIGIKMSHEWFVRAYMCELWFQWVLVVIDKQGTSDEMNWYRRKTVCTDSHQKNCLFKQ